MPHPRGEISVRLDTTGGTMHAEVTLPPGVTGEFVWNSRRRALSPGRNVLDQ
jgi:alpha-L-rhamnosidase